MSADTTIKEVGEEEAERIRACGNEIIEHVFGKLYVEGKYTALEILNGLVKVLASACVAYGMDQDDTVTVFRFQCGRIAKQKAEERLEAEGIKFTAPGGGQG